MESQKDMGLEWAGRMWIATPLASWAFQPLVPVCMRKMCGNGDCVKYMVTSGMKKTLLLETTIHMG